MRPGRALKKARAEAVKRILAVLNPAAQALALELPVGAEAIAFGPGGELIHVFRKSEFVFVAQELENLQVATAIGVRWLDEADAAEVVQ